MIKRMSTVTATPIIPHNISLALTQVRGQIGHAAMAVGRAPSDITLVAVSKTHGISSVEDALEAGQRHFGENRVQEALTKFPDVKARQTDLCLHLIGPLQTNKVKQAVGLFDVIHTVDRIKLADVIADEMAKQSRAIKCFIQVNTGRESQKAGALPEDVDGLISHCRDILRLPLLGLMCIPPADQLPGPHFAFLRELARRHALTGLSMGMSGDVDGAVRLGATHVRVGSAIFGARATHPTSAD